jgi:membrane-bound serine protease (ClpP class)
MQTLAQSIWLLLTNPNVSFVLLVLGLWATVLAVSLPGTGLPEAMAVVFTALAAIGLLQLPVSIVGLVLIGLALAVYIAEFQLEAHGALLLGGSIALGVGALVLFRVEGRSQAELSWATIVGAPLISALVFGFIVRKGLAAQRVPAIQDPGQLIGARGVTRSPVGREGTVFVAGELWSATSELPIPPEAEVVVVERDGLRLKVAPAPDRKRR